MAFNQGKLLQGLETLVSRGNKEDFIYNFLELYGIPKATITRLKSGTDTRNIGMGGDVGLKKKVYFRASNTPVTFDQLNSLYTSDVVVRNDVRFVILTDFDKVLANDLTAEEVLDIPFSELPKNYHFFLPITGQYEKAIVHSEHPADLKASEKMGQLFDVIRERNSLKSREDIHALNVFLTRLLFCFYAEDTDIFKQSLMTETITAVTKEDGSDLDVFFETLFRVLNLPEIAKERSSLPAHFNRFPYVNGGLFEKDEPVPEFGPKSRRLLLECGTLNWSDINPDIFGSMFQAVIDPEQRGNLGQHYTSVSNIMKVIQPLFLDKLYEELEKSKNSKTKLEALLARLQKIRVFDPACGSGNFLIVAYKELRKFEMEVFKALNALSGQNVFFMSGIQLSQFYGIEIDDFAHEIAILSLWLAEHQMNKVFAKSFGYTEPLLPLKASGNIFCGNSLRLDWEDCCPPSTDETYLIGNPPFLGTTGRSEQQTEDIKHVFLGFSSIGYLDFVAAWFWKGAEYIKDRPASLAFVSTNSICQGDQTSILWPPIFRKGLSIEFCYETFAWHNSAKEKAAVHVVIIGITNRVSVGQKRIFTIQGGKTITHHVENISPYLQRGPDLAVFPSTKPLSGQMAMLRGSMATDGGNFFLNQEEREIFLNRNPKWSNLVRKVLGATEFLNGGDRWCLWMADEELEELLLAPDLASRINNVKELRLKAGHPAALKGALRPHTFLQIAQPHSGNYLIIPCHSSENRQYIPIGFVSYETICTNANQMIPDATLFDFGVLTSEIHSDWMRTVAGRLKSDYRYSATLVYNTFPWPFASETQRKEIEALSEEVLLVREDYPEKTLAELYDPEKMPRPLKEAHEALDIAVDALYRKKPFKDSTERLEHLFALYQGLIRQEAQDKAAKIA